MIFIVIAASIIAAVLGFLYGRRYEKGSREVDALIREAIEEKRSGRTGTVRLKTMKIRR